MTPGYTWGLGLVLSFKPKVTLPGRGEEGSEWCSSPSCHVWVTELALEKGQVFTVTPDICWWQQRDCLVGRDTAAPVGSARDSPQPTSGTWPCPAPAAKASAPKIPLRIRLPSPVSLETSLCLSFGSHPLARWHGLWGDAPCQGTSPARELIKDKLSREGTMWGPFSAQTSELPLAGAGLQTAWWERGYGMGEGGLGRAAGKASHELFIC